MSDIPRIGGPADEHDPVEMDRATHRAGASPIPHPQLGQVGVDGLDSLGRLLLGSESMASVLHRAAAFAKHSLPDVDEASVTLAPGRRSPATAAWTGLVAFELDECQYGLGYGPCLQAAHTGTAVLIHDVATETRWPDFAELATRQGVGSVLSVPISLTGVAQAALNLYSMSSGTLSAPLTIAAAGHTADQVTASIANMFDLETARAEVANLQLALESRAAIEQAKGILMALHGYSDEKAFAVLSARSQETHTKLREVALQLIAQVRRD